MKKLSNTKAELKKIVTYKKQRVCSFMTMTEMEKWRVVSNWEPSNPVSATNLQDNIEFEDNYMKKGGAQGSLLIELFTEKFPKNVLSGIFVIFQQHLKTFQSEKSFFLVSIEKLM